MRSFYLDAMNESGSEAILAELSIVVNGNILNIDGEHIAEYTLGSLGSDRLDSVYKEIKSCTSGITYQSHLEGFCVDVRDSADCWLRICLEPRQSVSLPAGMYHRLYTDNNNHHATSFLTHTVQGQPVRTELRFPGCRDGLQTLPPPHRFRELTCELCRQFYECGWVTGTGGSISIRYGSRIYMTPSGVQKERIQPEEVFLMDSSGAVLAAPPQSDPLKAPKLTDCAPLFFHAYRLRNAGAVIHSHDISCVLAAALFPSSPYTISRQEMIKGIAGHGYLDELVVPIIENTPHEKDLADSLGKAIKDHPRSSAVLVRDHGMYVWGATWEAAKRHSECLHYLFGLSLQLHRAGLPPSLSAPALPTSACSCTGAEETEGRKRKVAALSFSEQAGAVNGSSSSSSSLSGVKFVLLDIEGTTTPIRFVKDVLFPYSSKHLGSYLAGSRSSASKELMKELREHYLQTFPDTPKHEVTAEVITQHCLDLILRDQKVPALKKLQGEIWKHGYASGALQSEVYPDVPVFLRRMNAEDVAVCIYSSGSRGAQQLLFQHTKSDGDLRPLLTAYFDTAVGQKQSASSYSEILLTLGCVETPEDVLFVTDIVGEAEAASTAGMRAVISVRPGNAALPAGHGFREVSTFNQL